jgi:FkbM family methyltransferase
LAWNVALLEGLRVAFARVGAPLPYRLYRALGGAASGGAPWSELTSPQRSFTDREGLRFTADLRDWLERHHYFCGYQELANILLLSQFLRPGDSFIDVGANRGVLTLNALRVVGDGGVVIPFEPNPSTQELLRQHLAMNGQTVVVRAMALGDQAGTLELQSTDEHHGHFSLRPGQQAKRIEKVPVARAADVIQPQDLRGRTLIKIDTEGFELHVLRGMGWLLDRPKTAFLIEVTDDWLRASGGSAEELFAMMGGRGFVPQQPVLRGWWPRQKLGLEKLNDPLRRRQYDVYFSRP